MPRPSPGLAARARPTGSPSARPSGVTADRTVACAAPTQNNVPRYAASAPHVATIRLPTPRTAYTAVRHQGQETPRRRAVTTPTAYAPARATASTRPSGSATHV